MSEGGQTRAETLDKWWYARAAVRSIPPFARWGGSHGSPRIILGGAGNPIRAAAALKAVRNVHCALCMRGWRSRRNCTWMRSSRPAYVKSCPWWCRRGRTSRRGRTGVGRRSIMMCAASHLQARHHAGGGWHARSMDSVDGIDLATHCFSLGRRLALPRHDAAARRACRWSVPVSPGRSRHPLPRRRDRPAARRFVGTPHEETQALLSCPCMSWSMRHQVYRPRRLPYHCRRGGRRPR